MTLTDIPFEQRSFFFRTTTTLRIDETEFEIHLKASEEDRGSDPCDLHDEEKLPKRKCSKLMNRG